jgi:PadR family transcriptional regulator PadR
LLEQGEAHLLTAHEQLVMLAIARCGRRAYALSIQEEIEAHGPALTLGVLYTVLGRLERRHLIRHREGDPAPERGDRPRRYYSLTGTGAQELQAALRILDRLRAGAHTPRQV